MRWFPLLFVSLLAACAAQPSVIVRTVTVTQKVPSYVPLDPRLTATVQKPMPPAGHLTNADLYKLAIDRGGALDTANDRLRAIQKLQPKDGNGGL